MAPTASALSSHSENPTDSKGPLKVARKCYDTFYQQKRSEKIFS